MRNAYILRAWNGKVVLLPQILDQLGIPKNCILHAVPDMTDERQPALVMSTIPVTSWTAAYRLVFYASSNVGSLATATEILAKHEIRLLSVSAAAISTSGEGCVTAIVELPGLAGTTNNSDGEAIRRDVEVRLTADLEANHCLSNSPLFLGDNALRKVRLLKLLVLSKLAQLGQEANDPVYSITVDNWAISLEDGRTQGGSPIQLFGRTYEFDVSRRTLMLVTPDTEERYVRLSPMHERNYREITFKTQVKSGSGDFRGYYEKILRVLARKRINIFGSKTVVTSSMSSNDVEDAELSEQAIVGGAEVPVKTQGKTIFSEEAQLSFTADVLRLGVGGDDVRLASELENLVDHAMQAHALERSNSVQVRDFRVQDLFSLAPLAFVATNAKPGMPPTQREQCVKLVRELKARGLNPINVDVSIWPSLREEVERLLDQCPLLISLYLPEESNRLQMPRKGCHYAPSDYTMYEEAYMCAKKSRLVFRLRHEEVFRARYIGDQHEFEFTDATFDMKLERLCAGFDRMLRESKFMAACDECDSLKDQSREVWINRDLEEWLAGG